MPFSNKSCLVTGGAGFIGSHVADKLLKEGAEQVTILDNFVAGSEKNIAHLRNNEQVKIINGSVTDFDLLKPLVQESDVVIHEAASKMVVSMDQPRTDLETNIIGPFNIIQAALDWDTRIVHASTGSVFGSSENPMKEDHVKKPTSPYGISKLSGETYMMYYAREFGLKASVIRYFHVFGPRQDFSGEAGVVSIFLDKVMKGKVPTVFSGGKQIRCFTYITDDVDATLLLAKKNAALGQDYNVASKTRMSVTELAEMIIEKYGQKGLKPEMGKMRKGENYKPIPDTKKIEDLGWEAKVSFEEGLETTKQWIEND